MILQIHAVTDDYLIDHSQNRKKVEWFCKCALAVYTDSVLPKSDDRGDAVHTFGLRGSAGEESGRTGALQGARA